MSQIDEAAAHVRRRREQLGLSRRVLAEMSGVYEDSIYNVETGRTRRPHPWTLTRLNEALDEHERRLGIPPEGPASELAPSAPEPALAITVDGVRFEVPVSEWETIDRVIDRVMMNLRKRG